MSNIVLSVVTGTYNRLEHLKNMVASARRSIGVGIPYEFVLMDGYSTDGTPEWCKAQPDIVLLESDVNRGAIARFNDALRAARGTYCVIANDDITFYDETLLKALSFMQDHPDVGIGCFYQDRDHPGHFDLSYMPAVVNGKQMQHVYGQVCIVPKWLGDEVGWWGDFDDMRTYGGDNNLSCFVLEKGYKVTGIQCACIHDAKVVDALRKMENDDRVIKHGKQRGHPDSNAWGKHWTHRDGTCGPIIRDTPHKSNPIQRKYRVLYLPIYEVGHPTQKSTKHGLRDALVNADTLTYEYDWQQEKSAHGGKYMLDYMMDIMDAFQPDLLLTQIHTPDSAGFNVKSVESIRNDFPNVKWVNWNGDYHPEDLLSPTNVAMAKQFDLQCVVTGDVVNAYRRANVTWMYWQIGYECSDAEPDDSTPRHDVVFLANGYSKPRRLLVKAIRHHLKDVNFGLYGSWPSDIPCDGSNLYDFDAGSKLYRAAKISIGDDQWNSSGYVSNRLFQAMAAGGAMYMQQHVPDLDRWLDLEDGIHYVVWHNEKDLVDRLKRWLHPSHDDKRAEIAAAGKKFVEKHHSFDVRVKQLFDKLRVL